MRGASYYLQYYLVFILMLVAFVAVIGMRSTQSPTGHVVLENALTPDTEHTALTLPQVADEQQIKQEVITQFQKKHIAQRQSSGTQRLLIIPKQLTSIAALSALTAPRHFFGEAFSADVTEAQKQQLLPLASLKPIPLYKIASSFSSSTSHPSSQVPWGVSLLTKVSEQYTPHGGYGVTVAVLDTGISSHPDINNQIHYCKDFTHGPAILNTCLDENGHGTHVAGIIVADGGNGEGVYGIAPQANLAIYKVCDDGGNCFADDIAAAIQYGLSNHIQIISLSLGGLEPSELIADAVARAEASGTLIVAAAGNGGPELDSLWYPARLSSVVSVGAIDPQQKIAAFSSHGKNTGDGIIEEGELYFVAPGVSIESSWLNNGYRILSGTSMAAPHIAGLAALHWQGNAEKTLTFLIRSSHDLEEQGEDPSSGYGLPMP